MNAGGVLMTTQIIAPVVCRDLTGRILPLLQLLGFMVIYIVEVLCLRAKDVRGAEDLVDTVS